MKNVEKKTPLVNTCRTYFDSIYEKTSKSLRNEMYVRSDTRDFLMNICAPGFKKDVTIKCNLWYLISVLME